MEQAVRPKNAKTKSKKKESKTAVLKKDKDSSHPDNVGEKIPQNQDDIVSNTSKPDLLEEGDAKENITEEIGNFEINNANVKHSPVPGHFYKLCATKPSQESLDPGTKLEEEMTSHASINTEASLEHLEPTAPLEGASLDSVLSPTAPVLSDASLEATAFSFDQSLNEIINLNEEGEEKVEDVLLPVQEDEWEFGGAEQPTERIYPILEDQNASSNLEPFSQEQLSMFYHNVLLEHVDTYVEQFLSDANDYNDRFKALLTTYYQARQQLIKAKQKHELFQETVQKSTQKVFVTTQGKVEAETICQDQRKVNTVHHYDTCRYDSEASFRLGLVLREDRRVANEEVALAGYSSTVARLHCEQCLFEVTENHKRHRLRLQENSGKISSSVKSSILLQLIDESVSELKSVCNVLFLFTRKRRCKDDEEDRFWSDVEKWIALIILHLLQSRDCATSPGRHFSEEMFVLNHVLRCPPGLHRWGSGLVQVSGPSFARDGTKDPTSLDHAICLLYLVLKHPKGREGFLAELKNSEFLKLDNQKAEEWTMIDDDGDEIDTTHPDLCLLPLESDLISIFRQIPLEGLVSSILQMIKSESSYNYSEAPLRGEDIMTTFATCDLICEILGNGLTTFGRSKYKQLVRRVAQAIRNVVLVVSQHWQQYRMAIAKDSRPQRYSSERLQLEFDEFYKRCVSRLLAVAKLGIYQFVADLSYHYVSSKAADTLYLLMNVPPGVRSEVDTLISEGYTKQEWLDFIQDSDTKLAFEDHLSNMPTNEIVYLLTTFANLAQARPSTERHLLTTIATDIFKVSFVYKSTRDVCSKTGRELLSSVAAYHPFIITTLLKFAQDNMHAVSSVVIYALSDLPFSLWQPTDHDITSLRSWILTNETGSNQCKLAQIIIQSMNFTSNPKSETLLVPLAIHHQLAILMVEACVRIQMKQAGIVMKSLDQVSKVASAVRLASHPTHEQFIAWCWRILFRLKLHQRSNMVATAHKKSTEQSPATSQTEETLDEDSPGNVRPDKKKEISVADITTDSSFLPVLQATKEKYPMACYVSLMIGSAGHRMDAFLSDGLEYAHTLSLHGHLRALLHVFDCVLPIFYESNVNLGQNQRFSDTLSRFLHCTDEGIIANVASYLRADASNPETSVTLLSSIINQHVNKAEIDNGGALVLSYCLRLVLAIPSWHKDAHLKTFVNYILKSSFLIGEKALLECRTMLYDSYVELMLHGHQDSNSHHSKNVVTSFLQMVSGGHQESPSFIGVIATSENIYFKFESLLAETRYEDDCNLWTTVLTALRADPKLSIDSCVKKASSNLKLTHNPSHSRLTLYRWAELALHTPHNHPLLPLVWYNFFLRFVYLPKDGASSLGCRFFDHVNMLAIYNKLRLRLQTSMEFHHGVISSHSVSTNGAHQHELLVKLYQSFKLWLEEPKMHECNLYLPSLPSQYNAKLLALVRTRNLTACDDVINKPKIKQELHSLSEKWDKVQNQEKWKRRIHTRPSFHHPETVENTQERITHLLKQFESPLPMPVDTASKTWAPPVSIVNLHSLHDADSVLTEIDQDLKIVSSFASQFSISDTKHHEINREFLKILPQLYYMKSTELSVTVECKSAFSATHRCAGAAKINLRFREKTLNDSTADQIQANRNLYQREISDFVSEAANAELGYASIHIECVIRALEANLKNPTYSESLQSTVNQSGIRLFYLLADMYSGERVTCLLTKKLLTQAVELLGHIFVSQSSDEASHILQQVISNPDSASLLSPHFAPGCKSRNMQGDGVKDYIRMYHKVVKLVSTTKNDNPDVLFVLLTKFEVESWLSNFNPSLNGRVELLEYIMVGMVSCNMKLQKEAERDMSNETHQLSSAVSHCASHASVHEVYLNHLRALLAHKFPDMLIDVLRYLLEASRTRDVAESTWKSFLEVAFPDPFLSALDPTRSCFYSSSMDWNTLQNAIEILVTYFDQFRNHTADTRTSGLYNVWFPYINVLSTFYSCMSNTYLSAVCHDRLPLLYTETQLTTDPNWNAIVPIYDLFGAWMQPVFVDTDAKELGWPWRNDETELARPFTICFSTVLNEFCLRDNLPASSYLAHVWSAYARATLHEKKIVPAYMHKAYHTIINALPWNLFVPQLSALDQMIQFSDGKDLNSIAFLCVLIPKFSWLTIVEMCRSESNTQSEWSPFTIEVLCRFLHLLLSLGCNAQRLEKYEGLEQLFSVAESLPWRCINPDQLDHLCHLACDRYSWTSPLLVQSVKSQARDPRCCAFRLLKIVCGLPLTGEEKGNSRTPPSFSTDCADSDWEKMKFFVKTVGQLVQKVKGGDKVAVNAASKPLARFIEKTYESIEMTSSYSGAPEHLSDILSLLFNYLNIVPPPLQATVCDSCRSVLTRKAVCSSCATRPTDTPMARPCQDCVYLRSRALSPLTLLSSMSSLCDTATYAAHTSVLLEEAVTNYMAIMNRTSGDESINEVANESWKDVLSAYSKPITNKEEFIKHSLKQGCVIALYVFALDLAPLPNFHASLEFIQNELPSEQKLEKLYEAAVLDVQWLSSMPPVKNIEGKFLLIWDHFLCVCAILFKIASLSPIQGFTIHSIVDTVASLLPILEQISQDKVKTGVLGSLGIGTQSPLSLGFRLTTKALIVYIKLWIAKADAGSSTAVTVAQNAFEAFKNLPNTNKMYLPTQSCIDQACLHLSNVEVTIEGARWFLAIFVKQFFLTDKFLSHINALT